MTERERWIVYPLLFLALGAALRDKLFDRTMSKSIICEEIVCQELTVVDAEPRGSRQVGVMAWIGRTEPTAGSPSQGYIKVNGQLDVQGVVNARHYAYQGVSFMPALPMGLSWPDLLRAIQQAAERQQQGAASAPSPQAGSPRERPE